MFFKMLAFEWRYFTRQVSFIVTCSVFFLLPFLAMTIDNVQIGSGGNVNFNSPHALLYQTIILGIFSMFLVVNFVANSAIRNETTNMHEIIYTKPINPLSYRLGRFMGAFLVCVTVFAFVPLGMFLGSIMPWLDAERLGPINLSFYFTPFLLFSVTTLFVLATIFYAVALRFKSNIAVYLVALMLFILYSVSDQIFTDPAQNQMLALLDPFAINTVNEFTEYWTPDQKNSQLVGLEGVILTNRLFWAAFGILCLFVFGKLFKPLGLPETKRKVKQTESEERVVAGTLNITHQFETGANLMQFMRRLKFEIRQIILSPAFPILILFSAFSLIAQLVDPIGIYGAQNWPLTKFMVELINQSFSLSVLIIVTYYTAEIVWRERTTGIGDIVDSMPVKNLTLWLSKLMAVCLVIVTLVLVAMATTILAQLAKGFGDIDIGQYLVSLFYFNVYPFLLMTVLAFFIQALSPGKYIGMLIFIAYIFVSLVLFSLGLEHNMFNYAASPQLSYSDMNGYGWHMQTQHAYMFYWTALAVVLGLVSYGMWHRGPESLFKDKLAGLSYQLGRTGQVIAVIAFIAFLGTGGYIHYNTTVLNNFISSDDGMDRRAAYEKEFGQYADDPFPMIKKVDIDVAIFPKQRRVEASAMLEIENTSEQPIERFLVTIPQYSSDVLVSIDGGQLGDIDSIYNHAWFDFEQPLMPGEKRSASLAITRSHQGFKDGGEDSTLVENGTFINNFELFPSFGVNQQYYLTEQHERRKRDLPPPQRAYALEDTSRYNETFFGPGVGHVDFSATLSTSSDQVAIAPGYLTREWQQDGRNYFRYEMDAPMINFFSMMSARLEKQEQVHNGIELAVYYHPSHAFNIERMFESMRDSLDYFNREFGPYQHKQMRIIEFPGYRTFAQSFANTVPYSERIGFITDIRDNSEIDPVYYITAHEVAHQWFGHQLAGANVQGAAILSESLSQYAALLVMEQKYGEDKLRKFLTYELDSYLRGRGQEIIAEMPMLRSENQQYIHYRKGSVVMMALRHRLGEEPLNKALFGLIEEHRYATENLPTTLDLVAAIKQNAPASTHDFIDQQFNQITLYDLKLESVQMEQNAEGQYLVDLTVNTRQVIADEKGAEEATPFSDEVEIVLFKHDPDDFSADNEIIYRKKHLLGDGEQQLQILLDEKPQFVGIDPFIRFIDRNTSDNVLRISD